MVRRSLAGWPMCRKNPPRPAALRVASPMSSVFMSHKDASAENQYAREIASTSMDNGPYSYRKMQEETDRLSYHPPRVVLGPRVARPLPSCEWIDARTLNTRPERHLITRATLTPT